MAAPAASAGLTQAGASSAAVAQAALQTRTKASAQEAAATAVKKASPVHATRAKSGSSAPSAAPPSSSTAPSTSSYPGMLYICHHCQRAFGRKISCDSHVKVCLKAKDSPAQRPSQGHGGHNDVAGAGRSRARTPDRTGPQGHRAGRRESSHVRGGTASTKPRPKALDDRASPARAGTRNLRGSPAEKSDLKPRSQQKSATPQESEASQREGRPRDRRQAARQVVKSDGAPQRSSQQMNSRSGSSRESSVESGGPSKDLENQTFSVLLERPSRSRADSKASSSRDSSVDSVRTRSLDAKPAQSPECSSRADPRAKNRSSQGNSMESRNAAATHDKAKPEENLLTISRQRFSDQLQAAATTRDKDGWEDASGAHSASRGNVDSAKAAGNKTSSERPPAPRTITTTMLRKHPSQKSVDPANKSSQESRPRTAARTQLPSNPMVEGGVSRADPKAVQANVQLPSMPKAGDVSRGNPEVVLVLFSKPKAGGVTRADPEAVPAKAPPPSKPKAGGVTRADPEALPARAEDQSKVDGPQVSRPAHPAREKRPVVELERAAVEVGGVSHERPGKVDGDPRRAELPPAVEQQPQGGGWQLSQRPKRKRRAPARITEMEDARPGRTASKFCSTFNSRFTQLEFCLSCLTDVTERQRKVM